MRQLQKEGKTSSLRRQRGTINKDVLTNQLSPHQKFKPIDFKENLIISMNWSEAMRVKDYQRLCQIVTKFEHKKIRDNLHKSKGKKEFGHYAQKKGYNILKKFEVLENEHLIEQLKRRTSLGIVRWVGNFYFLCIKFYRMKEKRQSKMKSQSQE